VIACEFQTTTRVERIEAGHPFVAELTRIHSVEYIDLPTGHWPEFTRPRTRIFSHWQKNNESSRVNSRGCARGLRHA